MLNSKTNNLEVSEQKFEAIANSANDAIILIDHKGRVSFWNKGAEKIFGYMPEEIIGKDLHSTLTPLKYREAQNANFEIFVKTGKGAALGKTLELEGVRKNGEIFPVELSLSTLQIDGNWNAVGIVRDISDRKNVEKELRESKKKYDDLLANLNDLVFEIDMHGKILFINQVAETIFNKPLEEIYKIPFQRFFNKESMLKVVREYKNFKKNGFGKGRTSTLELTLNNGNILQLKTTVVTEEGKIVGSRGIARDITEEVETKRKLLQSEEKFRILFEKSDDAIFVIDNYNITDCNQSALTMLDFNKKEDLINRNFWEFAFDKRMDDISLKEAVKKTFDAALEKGTSHLQKKLKRKDGKDFDAEIWLTTIPLNQKKIIHAVIRDITDRKQTEKELKEHRENLEKLLSERTAELIEYQEHLEDLVKERTKQFQESEKKYRELLDNSDDAIMRINKECKYVYVNNKALQITGFDKKRFLGKSNTEIGFPSELSNVINEAIDEVFEKKQKVKIEVELSNKTWIDLTYVPEFDADGNVISVLGSGRDITKRKNKERELKIKTKELELFNQTMINREMRIIELKEEINALAQKAGVEKPYPEIWKNEGADNGK